MSECADNQPGKHVRCSTPEQVERRRDEILDAAGTVFAANGYRQTDVQVVADQLQVGKGTIYRYFSTKEGLFLAAVDRAMRSLRESVHAAVEPWTDPLDQLAAAVRGYLAFFDENLAVVELLMQERAEFHERGKPTYFEYRDTADAEWEPILRELMQAGRVRSMPIPRIQAALSDTLYGAIFTNVFAGRRKSFEAQADDILDVLLQGILTECERSRLPERAGDER